MQIEVKSPFPFSALPRVWKWIQPFRDRLSDDFSPQDLPSYIAFMQAKWDRQKSWGVYADGELGGMIEFEKLSPWLGTAHCLFKPEFQGLGQRTPKRRHPGVTIPACRMVAAEIFSNEGVGKLEFFPLDGSLAVFSLLASLGAKCEGRLIGHTLCGGKPRDVMVFGLKKEVFEGKYAGTHQQQQQQ